MSNSDDNLKDWFGKLQKMQAAASQNLQTPSSICEFAQKPIKTLLPRPEDQDQFRFILKDDLPIAKSDLANVSTFRELLEEVFLSLAPFVQTLFQDVAAEFDARFQAMSPKEFRSQKTAEVYTTNEMRDDLIRRLKADIPSCWFPDQSNDKEVKLRTTLIKLDNTILQSATFVATLGLPS